MLRSLLALGLIGTGATAADARKPASTLIERCDTAGLADLDTDIAAVRNTTYYVRGIDLRVCVDKAVYPFSMEHRHQLLACYSVVTGPRKQTKRVCGRNASYVDYRGYRIQVWMRQKEYTKSSEVWLRIEKAPPKRPFQT